MVYRTMRASNRPGGESLIESHLSEENLSADPSAERHRKRSGARVSLRWRWRGCCAIPRVTSALIGASRPEQVRENVAALNKLDFSQTELGSIDDYAQEGGINFGSAQRKTCVLSLGRRESSFLEIA